MLDSLSHWIVIHGVYIDVILVIEIWQQSVKLYSFADINLCQEDMLFISDNSIDYVFRCLMR